MSERKAGRYRCKVGSRKGQICRAILWPRDGIHPAVRVLDDYAESLRGEGFRWPTGICPKCGMRAGQHGITETANGAFYACPNQYFFLTWDDSSHAFLPLAGLDEEYYELIEAADGGEGGVR